MQYHDECKCPCHSGAAIHAQPCCQPRPVQDETKAQAKELWTSEAARTIEAQAQEIETLRAQLTEAKDDYHRRHKDATERYLQLAEAVEILRAVAWTEPTSHYQRHWFPIGRAFCEAYDAKLHASAMTNLAPGQEKE